jgi:ELWxxDGT repeat protein
MPFLWDRPRSSRSMSDRSTRSRRARQDDHAKTANRQLSLEPLEERQLLAVLPSLIADLRTAGTSSSNPHEFVGTGASTFFAANNGTSGTELWSTQGEAATTAQVKDIRSGISSSNPHSLVNMGGKLYFAANDGINGDELWCSDGTAAGTTMVLDINSGSASSSPASLTVVGNTLYFLADNGANGQELWATDGTAANTRLVKDIHSGSTGSGAGDLVAYNGKVFFTADNGVNGAELWRSDGTAAGTVMVKDIYAGSTPSYPFYLTECNGSLFFSADNGVNGTELWKTDGTEANTVLVADIYGGTYGGIGFPSSPYKLTAVGNSLFFLAEDGLHGFELWKSDGTENGTVFVKDINTITPDPYGPSNPSNGDFLTNVAGVLYLQADDGVHGAELWRSDGTEGGTVLVDDINPGTNGSQPTGLVTLSGAVFFTATDGTHGFELWRSRGGADTTKMVQDIRSGILSSTPQELAVANGSLYFSADDGTHGREPWIIGPNEAPTDILLAPTIAPDSRIGASVGTLTTIDPDAGDEFWYSLVPGIGDDDNDKFYIDGDQLKTKNALPWDDTAFSVRVATHDLSDNEREKSFALALGSVFIAPEPDSPAIVSENEPAGTTTVGALSGKVGGAAQSFTFTLYSGADAGPTDNSSFKIEGGVLKTNAVFDYETKNTYTVAIQAQGTAGTFWTYETITIRDENDPPVVVDDLYHMPIDESFSVTTRDEGVLGNDLDQEHDTLHAILVTPPKYGTLLLNDDGSFTYTPNPGSRKYDSFTYRANDGNAKNADSVTVATVTLNWRPVGFPDTYTLNEDTILAVPARGVLSNDHDYDWEDANPTGTVPLTAEIAIGAAHGTAAIYADGSFNYTPVANYFGVDSFTYVTIDNLGGRSQPTTVTLNVTNVPDGPVAVDDSYANLGDQVLTVSKPGLLKNDTDADIAVNPQADSLSVHVDTLPASGDLQWASDGSFTYTPVLGYTGTVSFTYTVTDTFGLSDSATVTIVCQPMSVNVKVWFDPKLSDPDPAQSKGWLWEGAGTVTGVAHVAIDRSADPRLQGDILVSLTSSNTNKLKVPATVLVPAGQTEVTFDLYVQNDALADNNQTVTITGIARGLRYGDASTVVHDNEAAAFVVSSVSTPQLAGVYFPLTVTPKNLAGDDIANFNTTVPIVAISDTGTLAVGVANSAGGLPFVNGTLTTSVAVLASGTNVRLKVDDGQNHVGWSNQFQVTTGEMVALKFDAIPPDQSTGLGFQVTITAQDANGYAVPDYTGPLYLSGWIDGGQTPSVIITEASDQTPDYLEFQNVSGKAQPVEGWKIAVNNASSGVNGVHAIKTLTGSMAIDEVRYFTDNSSDHYFGQDIAWGSSTAKGWVMLLDDTNAVRDFLAWGYTASEIQAMAPVINGVGVPVGSAWTGSGVTYVGSNATSIQRWGNRDGNTASDFLWQANTKGYANTMLIAPFSAATAVQITPTVTGDFVGGTWTGTVTVQGQAQNMFLWATDALGNVVSSGRFGVEAVNAANGIGAYDPSSSTFYLRCENNAGYADFTFGYGEPNAGWLPIAGDWDGDGVDTVGLYDPKTSLFYLSNSNQSGYADVVIGFGPGADEHGRVHTLPVAGDWNGDGVDTIGIYDSNTSLFFLRDTNTTGMADLVFGYGEPGAGWQPTAGDWDGDGFAGVALYDPKTSLYYIKARLGSGYADFCFGYGEPDKGWLPFAGDWNNTGIDTVGVYDPNSALYYERFSNTSGNANYTFGYGASNWLPLAGDWNGRALLLAPAVSDAGGSAVAVAQVESLLDAAVARWSDAGLAPALLERLGSVEVVVTDLPGAALGRAEGNTVYIDQNAAGYGWFVDLTPDDNAEFAAVASSSGTQSAIDPRAVDSLDLLTTLSHELGHVAGLQDLADSADTLMAGMLSPGQRREPGEAEIDALLALHQNWL